MEPGGAPRPLEAAERADILRTLWRADILTHMPKDAAAVRAVRDAHAQLCNELRRPTADEQAQGMRHGLFPLSLAIVAKPSSAE